MELTKHFSNIVDFRVKGRCLHKLTDILSLILVGIIANCDDFSEIEDYGRDKIDFLRSDLGLELSNGIPSEDTLDRVMRYLSPKEVELSMRNCAVEIVSAIAGKQLCIDGKEHRGTISEGTKHSSIRTVSVWLAQEQLCFGQRQIEAKSSEKTAIAELIDSLDVKQGIITIDAIACQQNIVSKIINNEADYVIALKKNQGNLFEQVHDWMINRKEQLPIYESIDKGHGRAEQRKTYICQDLSLLDECQNWKGLQTIVMTESIRVTKTKTTHQYRFYISSLNGKDPKIYHDLVRNHWSIENQLHWQLDITFREDESRIRKNNAPANMNIVRKMALFLLSKNTEKISQKRKRKKASRDNNFLINVLKVE